MNSELILENEQELEDLKKQLDTYQNVLEDRQKLIDEQNDKIDALE